MDVLKSPSKAILDSSILDKTILIGMNSFLITSCILLAANLVKNFKQVFVKEIGLKSLTISGAFVLGTKVMKEPLIL
jgi:hypothetical protein